MKKYVDGVGITEMPKHREIIHTIKSKFRKLKDLIKAKMKPRVYGKKGRGPPTVEFGELSLSSPPKKVSKNGRQPLQERSNNQHGAANHGTATETEADQKARKARNRKMTVKPPVTKTPASYNPTPHQHPATLDRATEAYLIPLTASENVDATVEDFQAWTDERSPPLRIEKQGEGSFGEVYRVIDGDQSVILKIIPLRARTGQGSRKYTTISDASSEIQVLARMSEVPGFVDFRSAHVVCGSLPSQFLSAWNRYKKGGELVEARNPNYRSAYPPTQLWLIIEMGDAGKDLDRYRPLNVLESPKSKRHLSVQRSWDIFWQVAQALAKGEIHAEFEHRDLHLGNICIKDTRDQRDIEDLDLVPRHSQTPFKLDHTGLEVTIIDYTLSRATLEGNRVVFNDLGKDQALFQGEGAIQFDIYRHMEDVIAMSGWQESRPMTNVMWLYYLVEALLGRTTELSKEAGYTIKDQMTVTAKMESILMEVKDTIHVEKKREWIVQSATELISMGTTKGWFLAEDVINK